jgi:hypothetical protein
MTPEERSLALRGEPFFTCGNCGRSASVDEWSNRPVTGPLPKGHHQCPHCQCAFKRVPNPERAIKSWAPPITLEPIPSYL